MPEAPGAAHMAGECAAVGPTPPHAAATSRMLRCLIRACPCRVSSAMRASSSACSCGSGRQRRAAGQGRGRQASRAGRHGRAAVLGMCSAGGWEAHLSPCRRRSSQVLFRRGAAGRAHPARLSILGLAVRQALQQLPIGGPLRQAIAAGGGQAQARAGGSGEGKRRAGIRRGREGKGGAAAGSTAARSGEGKGPGGCGAATEAGCVRRRTGGAGAATKAAKDKSWRAGGAATGTKHERRGAAHCCRHRSGAHAKHECGGAAGRRCGAAASASSGTKHKGGSSGRGAGAGDRRRHFGAWRRGGRLGRALLLLFHWLRLLRRGRGLRACRELAVSCGAGREVWVSRGPAEVCRRAAVMTSCRHGHSRTPSARLTARPISHPHPQCAEVSHPRRGETGQRAPGRAAAAGQHDGGCRSGSALTQAHCVHATAEPFCPTLLPLTL